MDESVPLSCKDNQNGVGSSALQALEARAGEKARGNVEEFGLCGRCVFFLGTAYAPGVILSGAKNPSECFGRLDASPLAFHL